MSREKLKEREKAVLEYMKKYIADTGYPPSVRDICQALGVKSTSTVQGDIERLATQGYIVRDHNRQRAIRIVDFEEAESVESKVVAMESKSVQVPIVGRVAAGMPILAEQNIEDTFPVPEKYVSSKPNFMLRVKGESMIEAGIMNGDLILVEKGDTAENGEIVVAMVDSMESEATVKTFYKEGDHVRLQPQNHTMSPIISKDVTIVGKVKGVFRYYN